MFEATVNIMPYLIKTVVINISFYKQYIENNSFRNSKVPDCDFSLILGSKSYTHTTYTNRADRDSTYRGSNQIRLKRFSVLDNTPVSFE